MIISEAKIMYAAVVPIGNSRGIRLPKSILDALNIKDKVEMEVHEHEITLKPIEKVPRQGWEAAFDAMHENTDDALVIADSLDCDSFEWEW
jgi:antitoxin MazE